LYILKNLQLISDTHREKIPCGSWFYSEGIAEKCVS